MSEKKGKGKYLVAIFLLSGYLTVTVTVTQMMTTRMSNPRNMTRKTDIVMKSLK